MLVRNGDTIVNLNEVASVRRLDPMQPGTEGKIKVIPVAGPEQVFTGEAGAALWALLVANSTDLNAPAIGIRPTKLDPDPDPDLGDETAVLSATSPPGRSLADTPVP